MMWAVTRRVLVAVVESRGAAAFMTASLFVGVIVGLAAAILVWGITGVEWLTTGLIEDMSLGRRALLFAIPAGILVSWGINRIWGPGIESGGVTETMVGLSVRAGYLPTRTIGAKIAATAATLGTGGSAGREGPVVQIGATIGSSLARYTRFGEDQIRGLVAAGAAAGIAASFNAPIAGMLFAMEVILGNFAIRHLNAVVISSVAAAVTTRELIGSERILTSPSHSLGHPAELVLYAILGILAFGVAYFFLRVLNQTERVAERRPGWLRPVIFGLIVAGMILYQPELVGTGQEYLAGLLRLRPGTEVVAWVSLLAIVLLKPVATALTRGGGGSGGTMMPSLVIGGSLGAALAIFVEPVWGLSSLEPGAFAVVGMAATFAATGRAPLTSILIVFEITGDYNLVLPLMLAAALATFLGERFHPDSIYTLPLRRAGIRLAQREDIDLLDTVNVEDVMTLVHNRLTPSMTIAEAAATLHRQRHHGLPVVQDGRLVGVATLTDVEGAHIQDPEAPLATVMTKNPISISPKQPISAALARMAALGVGRLPVVSDEQPGVYLGMFRRESVVRGYTLALGASTDRHLYRERLKQRTQPGAGFFEMPIRPGSAAHGMRVREIKWPESATLVSVRRADTVLIPHGDTVLQVGDTITAFGTAEARIELAFTVEPIVDEGLD